MSAQDFLALGLLSLLVLSVYWLGREIGKHQQRELWRDQYDCKGITTKGIRVLAEAVLSMDAALTTQQPTQAQAGAAGGQAMSRDEIIAMGNEAALQHGHTYEPEPGDGTIEFLGSFAALAAAKEREAIAAHYDAQPHVEFFGRELADEIRARSKP